MSKPQELPDGREFYRLDFKVRPTEQHPLFWQSAAGILTIWIYAESPENAEFRSRGLLSVLPFEVIGETVQVIGCTSPNCEAVEIIEEMARMVGFGAFFDPYDSNADERDIPFPGEETAA